MSFEYANWPLPAGVYAGWSTRRSGVSSGPFASNNVAKHVNDGSGVQENRALLRTRMIGHPEIQWLNQTHSVCVVEPREIDHSVGQDGCFTQQRNIACCVMTADCLPVFVWSQSTNLVAAVHAGWRGLANGILVNAVNQFPMGERLFAGIGPAISQKHFEVGQDVVDAFAAFPSPKRFFNPGNRDGKYFCDLPGLAAAQLEALGVVTVYLSNRCTFEESEHFYSYRRDGVTGRMANLIWKT